MKKKSRPVTKKSGLPGLTSATTFYKNSNQYGDSVLKLKVSQLLEMVLLSHTSVIYSDILNHYLQFTTEDRKGSSEHQTK